MEWKVDEVETARVEARQGSQLSTRLFGGWHVDPEKLPKRLVGEWTEEGMKLTVEEAMGVGVMDPRLRRNDEEAFAELERLLNAEEAEPPP